MTTIIGIKLENRMENAVEFQNLLTKYGCEIKTRIGLHGGENGECTNYGVILLEVSHDDVAREICAKIEELEHTDVQMMIF